MELGYVSQYSARQQTGRPGFYPRQEAKDFPLACVSRPALRPTQSPIQCLPEILSRE
jgi:hypothetical protein